MPRPPRGTPDYETKRDRLPAERQLILAIIEESILSDLAGTHSRRTLNDGATADFTALHEFGLVVTFRSSNHGVTEFVDFLFVDA
jgi:hypothetical protein